MIIRVRLICGKRESYLTGQNLCLLRTAACTYSDSCTKVLAELTLQDCALLLFPFVACSEL